MLRVDVEKETVDLDVVEILDMHTRTWKRTANMKRARSIHGGAVVGHSASSFHVAVAGGRHDASREIDSFANDGWSASPDLNSKDSFSTDDCRERNADCRRRREVGGPELLLNTGTRSRAGAFRRWNGSAVLLVHGGNHAKPKPRGAGSEKGKKRVSSRHCRMRKQTDANDDVVFHDFCSLPHFYHGKKRLDSPMVLSKLFPSSKHKRSPEFGSISRRFSIQELVCRWSITADLDLCRLRLATIHKRAKAWIRWASTEATIQPL